MKCVFEASSGLEAHMILDLLELHRIAGRIEGEYLQGGVGELSAMGFVRVLVDEKDYTEAGRIISEWEASQPPDAVREADAGTSVLIRTFIAGVFVGALITYWLVKLFAV